MPSIQIMIIWSQFYQIYKHHENCSPHLYFVEQNTNTKETPQYYDVCVCMCVSTHACRQAHAHPLIQQLLIMNDETCFSFQVDAIAKSHPYNPLWAQLG